MKQIWLLFFIATLVLMLNVVFQCSDDNPVTNPSTTTMSNDETVNTSSYIIISNTTRTTNVKTTTDTQTSTESTSPTTSNGSDTTTTTGGSEATTTSTAPAFLDLEEFYGIWQFKGQMDDSLGKDQKYIMEFASNGDINIISGSMLGVIIKATFTTSDFGDPNLHPKITIHPDVNGEAAYTNFDGILIANDSFTEATIEITYVANAYFTATVTQGTVVSTARRFDPFNSPSLPTTKEDLDLTKITYNLFFSGAKYENKIVMILLSRYSETIGSGISKTATSGESPIILSYVQNEAFGTNLTMNFPTQEIRFCDTLKECISGSYIGPDGQITPPASLEKNAETNIVNGNLN